MQCRAGAPAAFEEVGNQEEDPVSSQIKGVSSAGLKGSTREARERGFTLAEVLVAIAVFAVISAIAMTLYTRLQKSFKQGENAATQQQNTRIAFDRMVSDLRMAGFNYNPDGDTGRPDEQIEGMWQNAVTVRGDFDFETSDATSPESTLGGPSDTFGVVSTGNDEIVTYALRKPNGSGGSTIQFEADVSQVPRDGTLETVPLDNIHLDVNSPPYTLYRITLKPGGTALSSIADYQPVADNVRNLEFTYYDGAGAAITTMAGGMDDPNSIALRKKIAKVQIKVVGMTQDPDLAYLDPADSNPASRNYRKYELSGDVTPRNLGFVGMPDLDLNDPNTPTGLTVCAGHCEALWTAWNANDPAEGVIKYAVSYGAAVTSQGSPQDVFTTSLYLNGLTTSSDYVVGVAAVDAGANESDTAYSSAVTVADATTPEAPLNLALTSTGGGDALPNQVTATWDNPAVNDPNTALACDQVNPGVDTNTPLRDLSGYRLFRGANATFDPNVPAQVQVSWDPNSLPGNDLDPNMDDTGVVNCRTYYYKALAEDLCGIRSVVASGSGSAFTSDLPAAPTGVVALDVGLNQAKIDWTPVTQDVNGAAIFLDTYKVWRASVPTGDDPNLATYSLLFTGAVSSPGAPSYTDASYPSPPAGEDLYYAVSGKDDCPNESATSMPALLTSCSFGGSVYVSMSPGGSLLSGTQTITATVSGPVVPVSSSITIRNSSTAVTVLSASSSTYPFAYSWNTAASPTTPGSYDILVSVTNDAGCTATSTASVAVGSSFGCGSITPTNFTTYNVSGSPKNNIAQFDLKNSGSADIELTRVRIEWEDNGCGSPAGVQLDTLTMDASDSSALMDPVPDTNPFLAGPPPLSDFDLKSTGFALPLAVGGSSTVEFTFSKAMAYKCGARATANRILAVFDYDVLPGLGGGTCLITLQPDLTSPGLSLCDASDPNCPVF